MRAVVVTNPGEVELNFMWLPTVIGMNQALLKDIGVALAPVFEGRDLTEDVLNEAHDIVVAQIASKFPAFSGVDTYLDSLKFVEGP